MPKCDECGAHVDAVRVTDLGTHCHPCADRLGIELLPLPGTRAALKMQTECWRYTPEEGVVELPPVERMVREIQHNGRTLRHWWIGPRLNRSGGDVAVVYAEQQPPPEVCDEVVRLALVRWKDEPWMPKESTA